jgi:aminoglycoside phosphotransferase (APT) family kinase protein
MANEPLIQHPLATGRTAEIYPWEPGQVLKLFRAGWDDAAAQAEAQRARAIHAAGLPAPAVFGVVELDGRVGIVYERISGISQTEALKRQPWTLFRVARQLAELHLAIHSRTVPELPSLKERLANRIQGLAGMPEDVQGQLLGLLANLPDGLALCHGDFHPENLFLTARGAVILDWMDAARGHPLADVARSSLLMRHAVIPPEYPGRRLIEVVRGAIHSRYLRHYFAESPHPRRDLQSWLTVVAAARMAEDIPGELESLIALVRAGLA